MHETRHRYIIVEGDSPGLSRPMRWVVGVIMFLLAFLYFAGFFYYGAEPLDSERTQTERR